MQRDPQYGNLIDARHSSDEGHHYVRKGYRIITSKNTFPQEILDFYETDAPVIQARTIIPFDGINVCRDQFCKPVFSDRDRAAVLDKIVSRLHKLQVPFFTIDDMELSEKNMCHTPTVDDKMFTFSVRYQMWIPK